jgi:hypothetical protein
VEKGEGLGVVNGKGYGGKKWKGPVWENGEWLRVGKKGMVRGGGKWGIIRGGKRGEELGWENGEG